MFLDCMKQSRFRVYLWTACYVFRNSEMMMSAMSINIALKPAKAAGLSQYE